MPKSLSRKDNHRQSLLRNLATSLILYEEVRTTKAKAKEIKPIVEHLIQVAKKDDLGSRRRALGFLFDEKATKKIFEVLVPRYKKIQSGFVKIYKIGSRLGDNAQMAIIKLEPAKTAPTPESESRQLKDKNVEEKAKK